MPLVPGPMQTAMNVQILLQSLILPVSIPSRDPTAALSPTIVIVAKWLCPSSSKQHFIMENSNQKGSSSCVLPASIFLWTSSRAEVPLLFHLPSPDSSSPAFCRAVAHSGLSAQVHSDTSSFSSPLLPSPIAPNLCPSDDPSDCFVPYVSCWKNSEA